MSAEVRLEVTATDGRARAGLLHTPRGAIRTPTFMPVGTRGAIVHLDANDYEAFDERLRPDVVLGNTYHLMLRPGADIVERLGGLHGFTSWDGHVLTDSGGYQVMSLEPKVDDDGVTFRSTYDGDLLHFTPEEAVRVQSQLGGDIQMALDVCPPYPSEPDVVRLAMERTHAWAARAREAHTRDDQALFGIVQGYLDPELRAESAAALTQLDFTGHGIGGLSVGEPRELMLPAIEAVVDVLVPAKPRYLMGVGDPASIVEAVARGVDMFDCVLPTRLARHGTLLTAAGRINMRNAKHADVDEPIDPAGTHPACARFSRGYLRHLLLVKEPTAGRILTLHNLWFLLDLVARVRESIAAGTFESLRAEVMEVWA
ncbi:MAG: tRNA guanosine(34) transglycosylase Tgt [Actinomycetota bacterium]